MAYSFKKLSLRRFPRLDQRESSEEKFWSKFQFPVVVKEQAPVTSIHFSATSPYDFAVTSGSRVQVYSSTTHHVIKTISRFNEGAYSGCFRSDGQLIAAGGQDGAVKVFELNSRAILRQFKGHTKPSKAVCFSLDGLSIVSGSDDTTVKLWDLSTEQAITTLRGHEDYVRCVTHNPSSSDLLISASYDHTVQLWDVRTEGVVQEMDHGAPVEAVVVFPSGGTCVSAGGNYVRVWDLLSGGRLLLAFSNHQKTITSLCFDGCGQRLLTAGLDKQLKVYNVEDYRVVQSISYPAPVLSMAMSPTDSHLVVGMTTKLLSIRHRQTRSEEEPLLSLAQSAPRGGTYRYFVRGRTYKPSEEEFVVGVPKKKHLQPYDRFLKDFQNRNALDAALNHRGRGKALIVYSLLQELARRDGLTIALSGRNEDELYPLLKFLSVNMTKPRYAPLLLSICNMVTDIYSGVLSSSKGTQALFRVLKVKIDREVQFQKHAFELLGTLDTILTASMATERQKTIAMRTAQLTKPLS